jgi:methylmalonyl-CoA carboxyltransferase large subunit
MITQPVLHPDFHSEDQSLSLDELLAQLASLTERLVELEKLASGSRSVTAAAAVGDTPAKTQAGAIESSASASHLAAEAGISEEEVLAISAALAAWLGVHTHIRQIRLIHTRAWAQQGRVTIQASHTLNLNH